jgi:hypothetical protein
MLEQAEIEARTLGAAGFVPVDASQSVFAPMDAPALARVDRSCGNGGTSWDAVDRIERCVYRRTYHAPGSGAFVTTRIEFEGATKTATVESTYVEATPADGVFPRPNGPFSERIVPVK